MASQTLFQNGNIAIKRCKHGYFAYNLYDTTIGQCLNLYGEWCEQELELFDEMIDEGDTVLDIGAYIGTHTVFFAQKVGSLGKVIACEPQRSSFQLLCTNLTLNALYHVECLQVGVSNRTATFKLPVLDPYRELNYGEIPIEGYQTGPALPLITIDSLQLERCDHLKIDVEGMEAQVLIGAESTIQRFRPTLYVENNTIEKSKELLLILFNYGYVCWWHFVPYFNSQNFFGSQINIFQDSARPFEANLLCFPKERPIQPQILIPVTDATDNWQKAKKRSDKNIG